MIMMVLKIIYSNLTNLIFISYTKTYLIYIYYDLTVIRNDFNYEVYTIYCSCTRRNYFVANLFLSTTMS